MAKRPLVLPITRWLELNDTRVTGCRWPRRRGPDDTLDGTGGIGTWTVLVSATRCDACCMCKMSHLCVLFRTRRRWACRSAPHAEASLVRRPTDDTCSIPANEAGVGLGHPLPGRPARARAHRPFVFANMVASATGARRLLVGRRARQPHPPGRLLRHQAPLVLAGAPQVAAEWYRAVGSAQVDRGFASPTTSTSRRPCCYLSGFGLGGPDRGRRRGPSPEGVEVVRAASGPSTCGRPSSASGVATVLTEGGPGIINQLIAMAVARAPPHSSAMVVGGNAKRVGGGGVLTDPAHRSRTWRTWPTRTGSSSSATSGRVPSEADAHLRGSTRVG